MQKCSLKIPSGSNILAPEQNTVRLGCILSITGCVDSQKASDLASAKIIVRNEFGRLKIEKIPFVGTFTKDCFCYFKVNL